MTLITMKIRIINTTFKQNEIWKRFLSMMNGLVTHSFTERASTVVVRK